MGDVGVVEKHDCNDDRKEEEPSRIVVPNDYVVCRAVKNKDSKLGRLVRNMQVNYMHVTVDVTSRACVDGDNHGAMLDMLAVVGKLQHDDDDSCMDDH